MSATPLRDLEPPPAAAAADSTATAARPRAERRWPLLAVLVVALLACGLYLAAELSLLGGGLGLPLDDSWIHLQFARNLAAGEGLAYNPGERVAGSTAPLWTALLSLAYLLHLPPLVWAKAVGTVCHLLTVLATFRLARELDLRPVLAALAALLAATTSVLVWGALSGMEVPLFTAASVAGLAVHVRARREPTRLPLAFALFALATLARPEGALLLLLAAFDAAMHLRRDGGELRLARPPWRLVLVAGAIALLALLPVLASNLALGGSLLPTTFDTKAGYRSPGMPRVRYLFDVAGVLVNAQPVATLLAPAGALLLLRRLGSREDRGLLPLLWAGGLPFAYAVMSGSGRGIFGNFGRYYFPLLPVVAVLALLAAAALAELPPRLRLGRVALPWRPFLALLLVLPGVVALVAGSGRYARNIRDIEQGDVYLARWLQPRLPANATLAVDDIGAFKYLLPNRVVDLAGIVSPRLHEFAHRSFARERSYCSGILAFVREQRPDYLAIFPRRHPCFSDAEFPLLQRLRVEGNITLAEDTIDLRATPWTRYPLAADPAREPARDPAR